MSNMIDEFELAGMREDFYNMLGLHDEGGGEYSIAQAKTLITIRRIIERGPLNSVTKKYDSPSVESIFSGPAHISPVTFRRDRQEIGGQEAVRIRQYRAIIPWDGGDVHIDDIMTINFSEDPEMNSRSFDITDVLYESQLAVRRISMTDTSKDVLGLDC